VRLIKIRVNPKFSYQLVTTPLQKDYPHGARFNA
jgi:hypothetical protein